MALTFRRSRDTTDAGVAPTAIDAHVQHQLERARDRHQTGALRIEDGVTAGVARIFLFQGHPYSVQIDRYVPDIPARLASSGVVTSGQVAEVTKSDEAEPGDHSDEGRRAGQRMAARGWISAQQLGAVHQELLLAAFGAAVTSVRPHLHFEEGVVTDLGCTVPVALDPLVESVAVRSARMTATWSTLVASGDPTSAVFVATGTPLPVALDRAEFRALLDALGPGVSLDEAGWRAGFTRAEAVHLTGMLAAAHVVALTTDQANPPDDHLLVPEQFGQVHIDAPTVAAPSSAPIESASSSTTPSTMPDSQRAELLELHDALASAVEEQHEVTERIAALRQRIDELTAAPDGADTP